MKTIHFNVIDSTNTYLKENYQNLDNFTFVSADYQTLGRGRNNRTWKSENGTNLLFSLLLTRYQYFDYFKSISIITAYTIVEVLREYGVNDLSIKWPNDVFVKDKKICGILLEAVSTNKMECLIVGVGLNVNQKEFDNDNIIKPISLAQVLNKDIDINELKLQIYNQLIQNLDQLQLNDIFYHEITKIDYLKDKDVWATIDNKKELVHTIGINSDYSYKIKLNDEIININSGEISFHN